MEVTRSGLGWLGAFAGVAATLLVVGGNANRSTQSRSGATVASETPRALSGEESRACDVTSVTREPWDLISGYLAEFQVATTKAANDTPEFLVATVPDPQTTNLALFFDRSIESLMWAIGDSGYTFERYWLPWRAGTEPSYSSLADVECEREQIKARHTQPGVMLFRRRPDATAKEGHTAGTALILLLVGESPAIGVNEDEFSRALDYVVGNGDGRAIRVAGPNFSGSLAALAAFANRYLKKNEGAHLHFVSPSVSSKEAICNFRARLQPFATGSDARVTDQYVVENDERAGQLFFSYVQKKWLKPRESGLLSEDDTAYGGVADTIVLTSAKTPQDGGQNGDGPVCEPPEAATQNAFHKWLSIRYPREISRLRNAEQDTSGEQPKAETTPGSSLVQGTNFSLKDQEQGGPLQKDTPPTFSRLQSPASQQGALLQISTALRREHVEYTGIIATDVLDTLFLTRFLRLSFPDTRVFTFDSDLLFLREGETAPFTGVLAITSYPLIPRNQHWTDAELMGGIPRRVPFTAKSAEGTYNAARFLLRDLNRKGELLLEYARPERRASLHPPLWLAVVGRDAYWPVALLDQQQQRSRSSSLLNFGSAEPPEMLHPESPSEGWYLFTSFVLGLALLHCFYVLASSWHSTYAAGPVRHLRRKLTAIFRSYPSNAISPYENPFLLVASLVMFCVLYFLVLVTNRFTGAPPTVSRSMSAAAITATVLLLAVSLSLLAGFFRRFNSSPVPQYVWLVVPALACSVFFCWNISDLVYDDTYKTGYFFAYRSLVLTSGVSPSLPILLLAVPYFYWAWMQLRREKLTRLRRLYQQEKPAEPEAGAAKLIPAVQAALNNILDRRILVPAIILTVLWVIAVQPWSTIRSIESYQYDWLYWGILVLLFYMVAVAWVHLIVAWKEFQRLLIALERQPIREAFSRLRKQITWVPLVAKPPEHQYLITVLSGETLRAICSLELAVPEKQQEWLGKRAEIDEAAQQAAAIIERHGPNAMATSAYVRLQRLLDNVAFRLIGQLENDQWRRGGSESLKLERANLEKKQIPKSNELLILIEEFIAYRYLMFIRYTFRHLRNLLVFVIVGFIFMIISLESYPFEAQKWIGVVAVITFLLFGIGIGYVFAQMDKDAILSRLTDTKANELSKNFAFRLVQFGTLPLLTVLTAQFPAIHRALASILEPALQALK